MSPLFVTFECFAGLWPVQKKVTSDCRRCLMATNRLQKPVAARLVQQMPNRAYRQRGTTPRNAAVSSTTGLSGKLEDWTETKDILARPDTPRRAERRCGCRANIGRGMSAVGRGPTADIPFVKTKKQDYLQKCSGWITELPVTWSLNLQIFAAHSDRHRR